ncbi:feather beta keratin-like [Theristicus caerulescens]
MKAFLEHGIKAYTTQESSIHFSCLIRPGEQTYLCPTDMSCYDLCPPTPCGPTPLANSCNEPCVRQCQDSTYVIQPPPVVVTLPGPILSSFPQNTAVGSTTSAAVGSTLSSEGVPISSGSSLGFGSFGYPGLGSGYSRPHHRYNTYRSGFYGPC